MFSKILNEKGFSLAQVMVASGLLGILAVATMNIMKTQSSGMNHLEAKSDEIGFFRNLTLQLSGKDACTNSFANQGLSGNLTELKNARGDVFAQVGDKISTKNVKIQEMNFSNTDVPTGGGVGTVALEVKLERILPGKKPQTISKTLSLQVKTNASDIILGCYAQSDADIATFLSEICQKLGGTVDSASSNCILSDLENGTNYEVFSKQFVETKLSEINTTLTDLQDRVTNIEGEVNVNKTEITRILTQINNLTTTVNNFHSNPVPQTCQGNSGRTRYKSAKAINCESETQFRSCNSGSWGNWSGTFSQPNCQNVECINGNTQNRQRTVNSPTGGHCDDIVYSERRTCSGDNWGGWTVQNTTGGQCHSPNH